MPGEVANGNMDGGDVVAEKIQALYNNYEILNNDKLDAEKRNQAFMEVLQAVHGTPQEKKLAAQFIPRFFKHFTSLGERVSGHVYQAKACPVFSRNLCSNGSLLLQSNGDRF